MVKYLSNVIITYIINIPHICNKYRYITYQARIFFFVILLDVLHAFHLKDSRKPEFVIKSTRSKLSHGCKTQTKRARY